MMERIRRLITITIILAVAAAMGATAEDASSAVKTPAKATLTSVSASGQDAVVIKWRAVKKAKGYQVYRNRKFIKSLRGQSTTSFNDTGLEADTNYTYRVRAYTTYKQKQWYNKKTKKWQKKKPARKYRGKSKKRNVTVYGTFSSSRSVATKAQAVPVAPVTDPLEIMGDVPAKIYKKGTFIVEFKMPCDGTIEFESSDPYVVGTATASATKVQLYARDDVGTATITARFTPASGITHTGNKVVTFDVENVMYPYNDDGSYTVICDRDLYGYAQEPTAVGGMFEEFTNILFRIPENAVIQVSYDNMKDAPNPHTNTYGWGRSIVISSSNPNAIKVDGSGAHFVGTGTAVLTLDDGKKITIIIS